MGVQFNMFKLSGDDATWVAWSGIVGNARKEDRDQIVNRLEF